MSAKFSIEEFLAHFETQMAFHKAQEAHHAEQEALHRGQKEFHAIEYETVARHFESFKATAGVAFEIASRMAPVSETALQDLEPGKRVVRSRLVAKVIDEFSKNEVFGAARLAYLQKNLTIENERVLTRSERSTAESTWYSSPMTRPRPKAQ